MARNLFHLICFSTLAITCLALDSKLSYEAETLRDGFDYSLTDQKDFELPRARTCSAAGPMCKDCNTRVNCVQTSENVWEEVGAHTCAADETCHRTDCTKEPNPPCSEAATKKFKCLSIGMFPDQFDCQRLHMCAAVGGGVFEEYTFQCGSKWMYDSLSTYCNIVFPSDGLCYDVAADPQWPVPACLEDGQNGAITRNPTIYYTCEKYESTDILYPMLRLCSNGGIYNSVTMTCDPRPEEPEPEEVSIV